MFCKRTNRYLSEYLYLFIKGIFDFMIFPHSEQEQRHLHRSETGLELNGVVRESLRLTDTHLHLIDGDAHGAGCCDGRQRQPGEHSLTITPINNDDNMMR